MRSVLLSRAAVLIHSIMTSSLSASFAYFQSHTYAGSSALHDVVPCFHAYTNPLLYFAKYLRSHPQDSLCLTRIGVSTGTLLQSTCGSTYSLFAHSLSPLVQSYSISHVSQDASQQSIGFPATMAIFFPLHAISAISSAYFSLFSIFLLLPVPQLIRYFLKISQCIRV